MRVSLYMLSCIFCIFLYIVYFGTIDFKIPKKWLKISGRFFLLLNKLQFFNNICADATYYIRVRKVQL